VRGRIKASAGEAVSFMVSESAATLFSLAIWSQHGLCEMMNPRDSCRSNVVDGF
jgi:hypothetical protein